MDSFSIFEFHKTRVASRFFAEREREGKRGAKRRGEKEVSKLGADRNVPRT